MYCANLPCPYQEGPIISDWDNPKDRMCGLFGKPSPLEDNPEEVSEEILQAV